MADFGLIGRRLGHSHSPTLHRILGGYEYRLFELEPDELEGFLQYRDFVGVNVTVPYKKAVLSFCDELSPEAQAIGSVNTVINRGGKLKGYNTDYFGFCKMVEKSGIAVRGKKCLVLGNGGVSPAVIAALSDLGAAETVNVSRRGPVNYVNLGLHFDAEIIVNATPVGMYPDTDAALIDLNNFPSCCGVFDLVYNPLRTKLICQAEELSIPVGSGLYMLTAQAAAAVELFTGNAVTEIKLDSAYRDLLSAVRNIVLIGMPGCGKTTAGVELCKLAGHKLFDIDSEIEKRCNCSIPQFFERYGEAAFRRLETEVLVDITKECGCIISTGGGVVCSPENYSLLHRNGLIVFLERRIEDLPTDGRPISQSTSLSELAAVRYPLYDSWCDLKVTSADSPHGTALKILEAIE